LWEQWSGGHCETGKAVALWRAGASDGCASDRKIGERYVDGAELKLSTSSSRSELDLE